MNLTSSQIASHNHLSAFQRWQNFCRDFCRGGNAQTNYYSGASNPDMVTATVASIQHRQTDYGARIFATFNLEGGRSIGMWGASDWKFLEGLKVGEQIFLPRRIQGSSYPDVRNADLN
ncbi:MAG: hypothetical protein AAGG02_04765 [Cyanobacteria bacterium P01_H01_bin.15]